MKPPMTKPNELTPEQAIERVEGGFHHACDWRPETEPGCGACPACLDNAALRLVIEAARESLEEAVDDAAALSFDEALRIVTRDMHWFRRQAHGNTNPAPLKRKQAAYKMVLEAAKRPTALSGEEREALAWMRDDLHKVVGEIPTPKVPKVVRLAALTAALSLASPKPLRFALPAIVPFDPENPRAGWQMEWHANGLSLEVEFVPREPCDWTFSHDEDGIIDEGKLPDDADEFLEALKKLCDFPLASPFTREELEKIQAACDECRPQYEEGYAPILAKLDAMLAQSSPANS